MKTPEKKSPPWVNRLQFYLAEEAEKCFSTDKPDFEQFSQFVNESTKISDWSQRFVKGAYDKYLSKIEAACRGLCDHMKPELMSDQRDCE